MKDVFIPSDQKQRDLIASALDETLFVEAGAGTGKTKSLVTRIANLITSGRATIDSIAAITFTEAAAAELRDRVRRELEERVQAENTDTVERDRCYEAVSGMENASIQTLHSFAGALLRECPLEAGLPPAYEVVEEIEADINFEERWQRWLEMAMDSPEIAPYMQRALNLGLNIAHLRKVAKLFHKSYDLLPDSIPSLTESPKNAARQVVESSAAIRGLLPLAKDGLADVLANHANGVAELGDRLDSLGADSDAALASLSRSKKLSSNRGRQSDWNVNPATGINGCTELKDLLKELEEVRSNELEIARRAVLLPLLDDLRQFTVDYVEERRRAGKAEFHDLLIWARNMLRDNPGARAHFQRRFSHILIDEFQDTDPIQAEIAFFLSGEPGDCTRADSNTIDWTSIFITPGRLFIVGDPKQSIYRFRRADIATVEQVRDLIGDENIVPLVQNFRSQDTIINWVNSVFGQWMGNGERYIQASYSEIVARWVSPAAQPPLGVHWFGGPREGRAAWIRREEAEATTAAIQDIKSSSWMVRADNDGNLRPAEYKDVCILIPKRTGLQTLERALEAANLPYRVESQSLVLGTQDVREMLACLRAIDSPADQVALVAALRSSAFGCSDVELLSFIENGGRLDYIHPGAADGPVRDALDTLYRFHQERTWTRVDELIEKFIRERRMVEVCFGRIRPRERLRRLRFIVERARAFSQVGGNSLRSFMDWMERQAEENARMVEIPVPETDEDAVRIMTIHGAKGLEFPIVILMGLGSTSGHSADPVLFDRINRSVEVRIGTGSGPTFTTCSYEAAQEQSKLADEAEAIRLMYVSTTRARDHLIISLFHSEKSKKSPAAVIGQLVSDTAGLWHELPASPFQVTSDIPMRETDNLGKDTETDRDAWIKKREDAIRTASRPAAVGVTTIVNIKKEESERGEVSYRRGRGGTNLGRAVHSVLQSIDLATATEIDEISRAQAAAEGIPDRWQEVAELTRRGVGAKSVRRAVASGQYYREVFVSSKLDGEQIEGFIDLLFEENDGLVIVDYKTDAVDNKTELLDQHEQYALQAGMYAFAIGEATGKPVREVVLVFLRADQEITFQDIDTLKAQACDRARSVMSTIV